jgi:hypothetical protein
MWLYLRLQKSRVSDASHELGMDIMVRLIVESLKGLLEDSGTSPPVRCAEEGIAVRVGEEVCFDYEYEP